MGQKILISNNWLFKPEEYSLKDYPAGVKDYEKVHLPHSNQMLPFHYFDEQSFQKSSLYIKELSIDPSRGERVFVDFEGVMALARVYLNGKFLGEHKGGYTEFSFELTDFLQDKNTLMVEVDSRELEDIPPFGGQIDYLTYGGIYRDVLLRYQKDHFIANAQILCKNPLEESKDISCNLFFDPQFPNSKVEIQTSISQGDRVIHKQTTPVMVEGAKAGFTLRDLREMKLWTLDDPCLYHITFSLLLPQGPESFTTSYGFRKAEFTSQGFFLNGEPLKILGLNRHQSFPYFGYAAPQKLQRKDAHILKYELGLNLVRTSHYPQSRYFLDECDKIGLLVFEEIPGWQHIGGQEWQDVAVENVREMISRDWNHPSIVIWGVRINESQDNDPFYTRTNTLARELDPSRQTGGVRYIKNSSFLEDVYTMNDFNHDGEKAPLLPQREITGLDRDVPYLITEFNGHMYPTKRFDQEERQMEHTFRHLRVLNHSFGTQNISGTIGWCAFDYNTHKDFGAGDRICYHGVMDMFRVPKFAAAAYTSQTPPSQKLILEPVTFWARGERSIGGTIPLLIATNCDYVVMTYGDDPKNIISKTKTPDRERFPSLPHPPVILEYKDFSPEEVSGWGMRWESVVIEGFLEGKSVIQRHFATNPLPTRLRLLPDGESLDGAFKDALRVVVKMEDQAGNLLPFLDDVITVSLKGPGKIMGPDQFALHGGVSAFWVEHSAPRGKIQITVTSGTGKQEELTISVQ